jgi:predicted GTPase
VVNHPATPSADHPVWEFFRTSYNIGKISEKEVEILSKEAAAVLMHKRIPGAKLAKTEAEAKAREAE